MRLTHLVPGLMLLGAAMLLASPESLTNPVDEDGALQWTSVANAQDSQAELAWIDTKWPLEDAPFCGEKGSREAVICVAERLIAELGNYPTQNVNSAKSSDGRIQGYQLLEHIFQINGYSATHITSWTRANSKLASDTNKNDRPSWCGILVNAIYLKAGVAVAPWHDTMSNPGVANRRDFRKLGLTEGVQRGDTCALKAANHHVLVTSVSPDGEQVNILQGNGHLEAVTWLSGLPLSMYRVGSAAAGCYRPTVWN